MLKSMLFMQSNYSVIFQIDDEVFPPPVDSGDTDHFYRYCFSRVHGVHDGLHGHAAGHK